MRQSKDGTKSPKSTTEWVVVVVVVGWLVGDEGEVHFGTR